MAATSVTSNINLSFVANALAAIGVATQGQSISLPSLINEQLTSGAGAAGKVNQFYQTQATLAASSTVDIDMYAFGGALDAGGNAFTMATVKVLVVQNLGVAGAVIEADDLFIGGKGTTAAWISPFNANTDKLKIMSGRATTAAINPNPGTQLLVCSGATGYVVGASTTNHILTLTTGANTGAITYNIFVLGATS